MFRQTFVVKVNGQSIYSVLQKKQSNVFQSSVPEHTSWHHLYRFVHLIHFSHISAFKVLLIATYGGCIWLVRPPGITANCVFNSTGRMFPPFLAIWSHAVRRHPGCLTINSVSTAAVHIRLSFLQHEHERKFIVEFHLWVLSSL